MESDWIQEVRKEGDEAANVAEIYMPFDRWLGESRQYSPWFYLGTDEVQLFREAGEASMEESIADNGTSDLVR